MFSPSDPHDDALSSLDPEPITVIAGVLILISVFWVILSPNSELTPTEGSVEPTPILCDSCHEPIL